MAHNNPEMVQCSRCGSRLSKEEATVRGWKFIQKATGSQGSMLILCDVCIRGKVKPVTKAKRSSASSDGGQAKKKKKATGVKKITG